MDYASKEMRGWEAARVRDAHVLPLSWDVPTQNQIDRIISVISKIADCRRKQPNRLTIEASILIILTLQTGRSAEELSSLQIAQSTYGDPLHLPVGLCVCDNRHYLVLKASEVRTFPGCSVPLENIILPQAPLLQRLVTMLSKDSQDQNIIFSLESAEIERQANKLTRGGSDWKIHTTKATRGLNALRRWFRFSLRKSASDDPAILSILSSSRSGPERVLSRYSTFDSFTIWKVYCGALGKIFPDLEKKMPSWLEGEYFGRGSRPADDTLREAISSLKRIIKRPLFDPRLKTNQNVNGKFGPLAISSERHIAMMLYTFAFATFGTGQRSIGHIVEWSQIDADTGLAWVKEKHNARIQMGGERGVFHAPAVCRQLEFYENYLDILCKHLGRTNKVLANDLVRLRSEKGLTLFDIVNGKIVSIKPSELCKRGITLGWPFDKNTGRHWLRSQLSTRIVGDSLAAQFGHHISGFDVWGDFSGLDPVLVCRDIKPVVSKLLLDYGFEPLGGLRKRKKANLNLAPDFVQDPKNRRARAGQVLASAIWNGAMLNQTHEDELIKQLEECRIYNDDPFWLELEVHSTSGADRWRIDKSTSLLLKRYRRLRVPLSGKPQDILEAFLGSKKSVANFRTAAKHRWRFRLPPVLFAKAIGQLNNRSLEANSFFSGRKREARPDNIYNRPRRDEARPILKQLECFVQANWSRTNGLPGQRKRQAFEASISSFSRQDFTKQMTELEKSIATALIWQFLADRGKYNTRGYSGYTILARLDRLWRDFIPTGEKEPWEAQTIDQLSSKIILEQITKRPRERKNVIADIISVLRAMPDSTDHSETIQNLVVSEENRMTSILRPDEYSYLKELLGDTIDKAYERTIFSLCYRTGLRFGELKDLKAADIYHTDESGVNIFLNHNAYTRLKTFHSRRKIPIELFLSNDEVSDFNLLANSDTKKFDQIVSPKPDEKEFNVKLRNATGWRYMSVYPLRHSFASNIYTALLWPSEVHEYPDHVLDALTMSRRTKIRESLLGKHSLGALVPHAIATMLGHTSPWRTIYSYTHNLEIPLGEHVARACPHK